MYDPRTLRHRSACRFSLLSLARGGGVMKIKLPGANVGPNTSNDEFQAVADRVNQVIRDAVTDELSDLLENGELPEDASGAGPTIVACVAAMLHSAGYLTASFEPHLDGNVLASIVKAQFNEGRKDFRKYHWKTLQ